MSKVKNTSTKSKKEATVKSKAKVKLKVTVKQPAFKKSIPAKIAEKQPQQINRLAVKKQAAPEKPVQTVPVNMASVKTENKSTNAEIVLKSITEDSIKEESRHLPAENELSDRDRQKLPLSAKLAIAKDIKENLYGSEKSAVKNQAKSAEGLTEYENEVEGAANRPVNIYRRIAYIFTFASVALLSVIFYFFFIKITISVSPSQEQISGSLILDIYDKEAEPIDKENAIEGVVKELEIEQTGEYAASGTEVIGKEVTGKVTIFNNYERSQQLVATTRFLSPDNKLFRLKDTVTVPAGGQVEAEIYADKPSQDAAIGPTTFKIPGLWAGLQDKIYGESKEPMFYVEKAKKIVQQSDINDGENDLKQKLLNKAKNEISGKYSDYNQVLYNIDESSTIREVGAKAGDEKEIFTITMKTKVVVAAFKDEKAYLLAQKKIAAVMPDDKKMLRFEKSDIKYSISSFDAEGGTASVSAAFTADVTLKDGDNVIDKQKIVGLNRSQLEAYLNSIKEIGSYEIKFYPSFLKKAPNLTDRIEIIVK